MEQHQGELSYVANQVGEWPMQESERSVRFEHVLNDEIDLIATARRSVGIDAGDTERLTGEDSAHARAHRASLAGLSLSGGGIRSATFNLGVLQALAKHRLLARLDYLSTVSGGGYIGAWLSAWIHRHVEGVLGVQDAIREGLAGRGREPAEISWLRDYSNYLMVRLGFFSGDSWATIAIYLRNLVLNLTLIIACLGLAVLLPRVLMLALARVPAHWFGPISFGLLVIVVGFIAINLQRADRAFDWARGHFGVLAFVVLPGTVASLMLAHALLVDLPGAVHVRTLIERLLATSTPMHLMSWIVSGAVLYTLPWIVGAMVNATLPAQPTRPRFRWIYVLTSAPVSGALLGTLCYAYSEFAVDVVSAHTIAGFWLVTGFGSAALVTIFSLVLVLHIGLVSRGFSEDVREWWARLGGWATLATLLWVCGFVLVIYVPPIVAWMGDWIAALGVGWIGSTLMGVLLGRSAATGVKSSQLLERVTVALPFVFVAGLVIAVAVGMHALLVPAAGICDFSIALEDEDYMQSPLAQKIETAYCELALTDKATLGAWIVALGLLAFLLQLRVDVNVFSLGPLYRNRLLRCYLGASRTGARQPHPFTGFDRNDDVPLVDLAGAVSDVGPSRCQRPYPIINTAINLTSGQKLAWQSRKAASFAFTPLFCGYQMPEEGSARWVGRYCATRDYVSGPKHTNMRGSIALSNAVTISGAAASPNAGYHTAPSVAFLLTVFNVRLGSWFQNPRRPEIWRKPGPAHALRPLLSELFGLSNDRSDFVYLSDGGHFENLGVYELVRRRCRFIIVCDASCDLEMSFEDLGNAIRKCRIDLDVDIEIDTGALTPLPHGNSVHHCALGLVRYDRADPRERTGYLLYVKASMSGDEPQDVQQYRRHNPRFPHQSTVDQFFDEAQFESYRSLGLHIMDTVLAGSVARARNGHGSNGNARSSDRSQDIDLDRLFKELRQRWYPSLPAPEGAIARHSAALDDIWDRIRIDERLRFLDRQLNPEWPYLESAVGASSPEQPWLPDDVHALRAAFYLCGSIIQLMENVYLDLGLEERYDHPDNRGWMNMFRRFAGAGMLRITWAITSATFGARFQSFCERRFRLGEYGMEITAAGSVRDVLDENADASSGLPERAIVSALARAGEADGSDSVLRFSLSVRPALTVPGDAQPFAFPVAFAIVRNRASPHPILRYFRIADHLQRMGLGWRATAALLASYPQLELGLATRAPELRTAAAEADRVRYVRLFRAAKRVAVREDASLERTLRRESDAENG